MTVAGRRSRTAPGPDGAPRDQGLDVRWGEDYKAIVSVHPELRSYILRVARDAWDQGHRARRGTANPFWLDPDIAGHDSTPTLRSLLGAPVDKIKPYAKAIVAFIGFLVTFVGPEFADNEGVQRWVRIAAGLATTLGVFLVPNQDPNAEHQDESVQPPAPEYDARHN